MRHGKILVLGPGEAGKSTLVRVLSTNATNLEVRGRTVAMDHGTLSRNGTVLHLVGVPGQARFAAVREALARGAAGAIWVLPAEARQPDPSTADLLAALTVPGPPYLVCVNQRGLGPGQILGPQDPFIPPRPLPEPRSVLYGNILNPRSGFLEELVEETWGLLHRPQLDFSRRKHGCRPEPNKSSRF